MPRLRKAFRPERTLDPDDPLVLRATARLMADQHDALAIYGRAGDPWAFCRDLVYTLDEATAAVRKFPDRRYLEHLTRIWQREPLLAIPKSRRMMVTWLFIALHYWLARFTPGAKIPFMARKEGKDESQGSNELVRRAWFIHEHVEAALPSVEAEYHTGRIQFAHGAEIIALGEGADQARQHTFTACLADEFGFWTQAYETWTALKPTIEGGGRITILSSAYPGFWSDLVHDQLVA
jgi:hypothetical protein